MPFNYQDAYLAQVKKDNMQVAIYLVNGIQLKGLVKGFDNFTIVLENQDKNLQLIYKHSVTTINSFKPVNNQFLQMAAPSKKNQSDAEENINK